MISDLEDLQKFSDDDVRSLFMDIEFEEQDSVKKEEVATDFCQTCKSSENIINDTVLGIVVCKNCGQVLGSVVDQNPEWRQFDEDGKSDNARCGMPVNKLLPQSSLGTTIGGTRKSRLKTLHCWSAMPYKERSLHIVFKEIQSRCQKSNIFKCIEEDAKIMYYKISECKHLKGKNKGKFIIIRGANRRSLIAACVFFACRRKGMTRSPREIADMFELKYTEMTKGCKNFLKLIKIKNMELNMGTSLPEHFVTRFCNDLKIKQVYIDQAIQIAKNLKKLNIASVHTPFSTATGSILLMGEINGLNMINKKKLAIKFKVSEVTISKTYKKIEPYKKALVNNELTDKIVKMIQESMDQDFIPDEITDRLKKFAPAKVLETKIPVDVKQKGDDSDDEIYDYYDDDENEFGSESDDNLDNLLCTIDDDIMSYVDFLDLDLIEHIDETEKHYSYIISKFNKTSKANRPNTCINNQAFQ
jgi:transcription initiation factor TFIIIB Brf1 subunit/transcription initiation factor TFIIB